MLTRTKSVKQIKNESAHRSCVKYKLKFETLSAAPLIDFIAVEGLRSTMFQVPSWRHEAVKFDLVYVAR